MFSILFFFRSGGEGRGVLCAYEHRKETFFRRGQGRGGGYFGVYEHLKEIAKIYLATIVYTQLLKRCIEKRVYL
jgi:hypothetical protein